jgi:hypothetical protein
MAESLGEGQSQIPAGCGLLCPQSGIPLPAKTAFFREIFLRPREQIPISDEAKPQSPRTRKEKQEPFQ